MITQWVIYVLLCIDAVSAATNGGLTCRVLINDQISTDLLTPCESLFQVLPPVLQGTKIKVRLQVKSATEYEYVDFVFLHSTNTELSLDPKSKAANPAFGSALIAPTESYPFLINSDVSLEMTPTSSNVFLSLTIQGKNANHPAYFHNENFVKYPWNSSLEWVTINGQISGGHSKNETFSVTLSWKTIYYPVKQIVVSDSHRKSVFFLRTFLEEAVKEHVHAENIGFGYGSQKVSFRKLYVRTGVAFPLRFKDEVVEFFEYSGGDSVRPLCQRDDNCDHFDSDFPQSAITLLSSSAYPKNGGSSTTPSQATGSKSQQKTLPGQVRLLEAGAPGIHDFYVIVKSPNHSLEMIGFRVFAEGGLKLSTGRAGQDEFATYYDGILTFTANVGSVANPLEEVWIDGRYQIFNSKLQKYGNYSSPMQIKIDIKPLWITLIYLNHDHFIPVKKIPSAAQQEALGISETSEITRNFSWVYFSFKVLMFLSFSGFLYNRELLVMARFVKNRFIAVKEKFHYYYVISLRSADKENDHPGTSLEAPTVDSSLDDNDTVISSLEQNSSLKTYRSSITNTIKRQRSQRLSIPISTDPPAGEAATTNNIVDVDAAIAASLALHGQPVEPYLPPTSPKPEKVKPPKKKRPAQNPDSSLPVQQITDFPIQNTLTEGKSKESKVLEGFAMLMNQKIYPSFQTNTAPHVEKPAPLILRPPVPPSAPSKAPFSAPFSAAPPLLAPHSAPHSSPQSAPVSVPSSPFVSMVQRLVASPLVTASPDPQIPPEFNQNMFDYSTWFNTGIPREEEIPENRPEIEQQQQQQQLSTEALDALASLLLNLAPSPLPPPKSNNRNRHPPPSSQQSKLF
jgi:hypothetical protein